MSECYGCGKALASFEKTGYWWLAGKQRSFCAGRSSYYPKKPCLTKAFFRLADDYGCPICGEEWSSQGQPCNDCEAMLKLGRETHSKTVELRTEIAAEILATFLRFDGWGDDNMAYPFNSVAEGEDRYSRALELRRATVKLWERWAELHEAKGLVEGSNLLSRLHAGETSLVDYEVAREGAAEKIPVVKRDLERLTLEVVELAKKIGDHG